MLPTLILTLAIGFALTVGYGLLLHSPAKAGRNPIIPLLAGGVIGFLSYPGSGIGIVMCVGASVTGWGIYAALFGRSSQ